MVCRRLQFLAGQCRISHGRNGLVRADNVCPCSVRQIFLALKSEVEQTVIGAPHVPDIHTVIRVVRDVNIPDAQMRIGHIRITAEHVFGIVGQPVIVRIGTTIRIAGGDLELREIIAVPLLAHSILTVDPTSFVLMT